MRTNSPEEGDLLIQKLPCDMGIHRNPRKGTLNAPETLLDKIEFERKILMDQVFPDEFDLEETHQRIRKNTDDLVEYGKPLLSIGGDHSVSYSVVSALKEKHPDLKLIWLDSHLDLKEMVGDNVSHDVVVRQLVEEGFDESDIWLVGITRIDRDEEEFLEEHQNLRVFMHDELDEFLREFDSSEQPVYLSVDIDVLKNEIAPGTGYPDGELGLEEVQKVIQATDTDFADAVEVAPPLDEERKTVKAGREIIKDLSESLVR